MSKFTWADMQLCKNCHYADKEPDICKADDKAKEKPSPMYHIEIKFSAVLFLYVKVGEKYVQKWFCLAPNSN